MIGSLIFAGLVVLARAAPSSDLLEKIDQASGKAAEAQQSLQQSMVDAGNEIETHIERSKLETERLAKKRQEDLQTTLEKISQLEEGTLSSVTSTETTAFSDIQKTVDSENENLENVASKVKDTLSKIVSDVDIRKGEAQDSLVTVQNEAHNFINENYETTTSRIQRDVESAKGELAMMTEKVTEQKSAALETLATAETAAIASIKEWVDKKRRDIQNVADKMLNSLNELTEKVQEQGQIATAKVESIKNEAIPLVDKKVQSLPAKIQDEVNTMRNYVSTLLSKVEDEQKNTKDTLDVLKNEAQESIQTDLNNKREAAQHNIILAKKNLDEARGKIENRKEETQTALNEISSNAQQTMQERVRTRQGEVQQITEQLSELKEKLT